MRSVRIFESNRLSLIPELNLNPRHPKTVTAEFKISLFNDENIKMNMHSSHRKTNKYINTFYKMYVCKRYFCTLISIYFFDLFLCLENCNNLRII